MNGKSGHKRYSDKLKLKYYTMDKTSIIFYSVAIAGVAVSLYRKYAKKEKGKLGSDSKNASGTYMSTSSKDDDYEPYSKK